MLEDLRIARPCSADWDAMKGDERVRFCGLCQLNVYNLTGMKREDAETLVASREGRLCVRFYERSDGKVLTQDCPEGVALATKRKIAVAAASVFGLLSVVAVGVLGFLGIRSWAVAKPPVPECAPAKMGRIKMGDVAESR